MINPAAWHLWLNHIPVFGLLAGLLLLFYGRYRKADAVTDAARISLILAALFVFPVLWTGEPAEEVVEHLPGVSHDQIHEHEELGEKLVWILALCGLMALAPWIMPSKVKYTTNYERLLMLVSTLALALSLYTAYEGGKIRHTELHSATESHQHDNEHHEHDDD
jgi:uncharacterized membrane protein